MFNSVYSKKNSKLAPTLKNEEDEHTANKRGK